MKRRRLGGCLIAFLALASTQCTGGSQSGNEGRGTDEPGDDGRAGRSGSSVSAGTGGMGGSDTDGGTAGTGPGGMDGGAGTGPDGGGGGASEPPGDWTCRPKSWRPCQDEDAGCPSSETEEQDDAGTESGRVCGPYAIASNVLSDNLPVCEASPVEAERDCKIVCGTLVACSGEVACDACLQRCAASPRVDGYGISDKNCLALEIYFGEYDSCEGILQTYADFESDRCTRHGTGW